LLLFLPELSFGAPGAARWRVGRARCAPIDCNNMIGGDAGALAENGSTRPSPLRWLWWDYGGSTVVEGRVEPELL